MLHVPLHRLRTGGLDILIPKLPFILKQQLGKGIAVKPGAEAKVIRKHHQHAVLLGDEREPPVVGVERELIRQNIVGRERRTQKHRHLQKDKFRLRPRTRPPRG